MYVLILTVSISPVSTDPLFPVEKVTLKTGNLLAWALDGITEGQYVKGM